MPRTDRLSSTAKQDPRGTRPCMQSYATFCVDVRLPRHPPADARQRRRFFVADPRSQRGIDAGRDRRARRRGSNGASLPAGAWGRRHPRGGSLVALPRYQPRGARRRLRLDVLDARARDRPARGPVFALLHVVGGSDAALLFELPRLHGRDAWNRAVGQLDPDGVLLGAHQPVLVRADRLLEPSRRRAPRRTHGAHRDRRGRAVPARPECC